MLAGICLDDDIEICLVVVQKGAVNFEDEFLASGMLYSCYHPSKILDLYLTIP